jgi:hypothetical protein
MIFPPWFHPYAWRTITRSLGCETVLGDPVNSSEKPENPGFPVSEVAPLGISGSHYRDNILHRGAGPGVFWIRTALLINRLSRMVYREPIAL